MSPITRSRAKVVLEPGFELIDHKDADKSTSDGYDSDSSVDSSGCPTTPSVIYSPTRTLYQIDHLPKNLQDTVREAFRDPPDLAFQRCRLANDTYAFQMTELVTRSVRIQALAASDADDHKRFRCSCGSEKQLCEHLLWFFDRLTKEMLVDTGQDEPLTLTKDGYPNEMGDPFQSIADQHLNIVAQRLHCEVVGAAGPRDDESEHFNTHRILEAREMLAAVDGSPVDEFRPDLSTKVSIDRTIIRDGDLHATVFNMLLDNPAFFHYFLSISSASDQINDPFRKLSQRIDRVLSEFQSELLRTPDSKGMETPCDVAWAAKHIVDCVSSIRAAIFLPSRPLQPSEQLSAARTIVHILSRVTQLRMNASPETASSDHDLYTFLLKDQGQGFAIEVLALIPAAASQFLHRLEDILSTIKDHGATETHLEEFRALLARLRSRRIGSGMKRGVAGNDSNRQMKRMK